MDAHEFFKVLLLVLIAARVLGELAVLMKIPSVLGELTAGILLGPSLLGWVEPVEPLRLLAEIGIILLLFEVGLDTDLTRLARAGNKSVIVAIGGVVLPLVLGYLAGRFLFGLSDIVSLFIGGALTATSIGITVRVLTDLGFQHGCVGQIVLGAAVLDDIIGVILLAVIYEFAVSGVVDIVHVGKIFAFVSVFFLAAPFAARLVSSLIGYLHSKPHIPGMIPTMIVALVLLFAWLARELGAPEILGGFAAGLALSRRFFLPFGIALRTHPGFGQQIEDQMRPIVFLFTPIFFVVVGLSLDLQAVDWHSFGIWGMTLTLLVIAVIGKFAGAMLISESPVMRTAIGVAMIPRGEVGLIFAEIGHTSGVLGQDVYAALILVMALTTLGAPLALKRVLEEGARREC